MDIFKTNRDVYNELEVVGDKSDFKYIVNKILENIDFAISSLKISQLEEKVRLLCTQIDRRWTQCSRNRNKFLQKNADWLNLSFDLRGLLTDDNKMSGASIQEKQFSECSERHKMRRTEELRNNFSADELLFAAKMNFRKEGKKLMAEVLGFLIENQDAALKIKKACFEVSNSPVKTTTFSKEKALSLTTLLNLSKANYIALRKETNNEGFHIFPSYFQIQKAKKECFPIDAHISVTEIEARISLQALLDLTMKRMMIALPPINTDTKQDNTTDLILISKWGCDGSSGQSIYKQKFAECQDVHESSCFMTSLVPIKLIDSTNSRVIWENCKPSSTRLCRPIRFAFCKETKEVIKEEVARVESEIAVLQPTRIGNMNINHRLLLTMVDGKICNALTETSSAMRCFICGATPKMMNNLELIDKRTSNEEFYSFGISPLHAKIRSFEFLLHLSYNLDFEKWSASTLEHRELQQSRKKEIQEKFRIELGLYVDRVKQGVGTCNDGNTARKFFEDPCVTAEITGLDEQLIRRFGVIVQALSSKKSISAQNFGLYAKETAALFISKYSWYYMPVTVHKILIHGEDIIKNALVPIGQLSEEAQESRNKDFRKFRESRSRKINRKCTNEDVFNSLLISSDPFITHLCSNHYSSITESENMFPELLDLLSCETKDIDSSPLAPSDCDTNSEDERMDET